MKNTKTIFLVDDNEIDCLVAQKLLENVYPDCLVNTFLSANAALELLHKQIGSKTGALPDLILLDLNMPIKDGWEFVDEYTSAYSQTSFPLPPIYILTSSINPLDHQKAKASALVVDFLVKPLTIQTLHLLQ